MSFSNYHQTVPWVYLALLSLDTKKSRSAPERLGLCSNPLPASFLPQESPAASVLRGGISVKQVDPARWLTWKSRSFTSKMDIIGGALNLKSESIYDTKNRLEYPQPISRFPGTGGVLDTYFQELLENFSGIEVLYMRVRKNHFLSIKSDFSSHFRMGTSNAETKIWDYFQYKYTPY